MVLLSLPSGPPHVCFCAVTPSHASSPSSSRKPGPPGRSVVLPSLTPGAHASNSPVAGEGHGGVCLVPRTEPGTQQALNSH